LNRRFDRTRKYSSLVDPGVLILISSITKKSYQYLLKFARYINNFMQFALKTLVVQGHFIFQELVLDLDSDVQEIYRIRCSLVDNGYAKISQGTLVLSGDDDNEGIYLRKSDYVVRKIYCFKDKFYEHIFDILRYKLLYRTEIRDRVQKMCLLGGQNELFLRIEKKKRQKNIYHDNWCTVTLYHFCYRAQIPGYGEFISPGFSNFLGRFDSHILLQDYTLRFRVEGIGSIVIGEQAFNDQEVAYSKIITTDGDKISVSVQETKEFFSIHFDTSNKGPQFIMFTVNSDSFLKSIRKLRVQFHGNVLVHRMSIVCRAWKTDFCLENTGLCALKCEWEADKCVRLGNCMRAPVSACSVCKRNFMSTILNNTKGSSTEFLISSLREAAYYRESLDVLSDDVFFYCLSRCCYGLESNNGSSSDVS